MAPGLWISVVTLLAGYFVCPSGSLVGANTLGTDWNNGGVTSDSHSNNNSMANDSSDHGKEHHGVHIANWRWDEIGVFFTFAVFIIVSGLSKVGKLLWIYYTYYGGTVLVCAYSVSIIFGTVGQFKQLRYINFPVLNMVLFFTLLAFHHASTISEHIPESW
jgi:hypothetical protein